MQKIHIFIIFYLANIYNNTHTLPISSLAFTTSLFDKIKEIRSQIKQLIIHCNYTVRKPNDPLSNFSCPQEIAAALRTLEQDALNIIKTTFNVSDDIWVQEICIIKNIQKLALQRLTQPNQKATHDTHIPEQIREKITQLLSAHNIHPKAITLSLNKIQGVIACALSPLNLDNPAEIQLHINNFEKLSVTEQEAVILHEITHLLEGHTYYHTLLVQLIHQETGIAHKEIENHPAFLAYHQIQELIASLLLATQNQNIAKIMLIFMQERYYKYGNAHIKQTHPAPSVDYQWAYAIHACHQKHTVNNCC